MAFKFFFVWAERQSGRKLRSLQINNALEFQKLGRRLSELGVAHRMSAPYSHQQKGHVERQHRHLIDTTIALINHAGLPQSMSNFSVLMTSYLYNRNPTSLLQGRSPLEVMFGRMPEYAKLCIFGYKSFPCLHSYRANKLEVKSLPCIFVGYSPQHDVYLYLDQASHRIFTSRNVVFGEEDFLLNKLLPKDTLCKNSLKLGHDDFGDRVEPSGSSLPDNITSANNFGD